MFRLAAGSGLALGLILSACGTGGGAGEIAGDPRWGAEALAWAEARTDGSSTVSLAAADIVVVNQRGKGRTTEGPRAYNQTLQELFDDNAFDDDGVFVDVGSGITLKSADGVGRSPWHWATHDVIDEAGVRYTRAFLALDVGRAVNALYEPSFARLEELADRYVAAWNAGDVDTRAALYAPAAVLTDSLRGIESYGRNQVVSDSVGNDWPSADSEIELQALGENETAAIYYFWRRVGQPEEVLIVLRTAKGAECPRRMAVQLGLADDGIVSERRFHEVESFRRCEGEDLRPRGWWTGLLPQPAHERITGEVVTDRGGTIVVRGGSTVLDSLLTWGLSRFEEGGLEQPSIGSVTFAPLAHECADVAGLATHGDETHELLVCLDEGGACADDGCTEFRTTARLTILHELAHVWLSEQLADREEQAFVAHAGLETWSDRSAPWPARGVEQAAEVIAWGLMDRDLPLTRIGSPGCPFLSDSYRLLTATVPLRICIDG